MLNILKFDVNLPTFDYICPILRRSTSQYFKLYLLFHFPASGSLNLTSSEMNVTSATPVTLTCTYNHPGVTTYYNLTLTPPGAPSPCVVMSRDGTGCEVVGHCDSDRYQVVTCDYSNTQARMEVHVKADTETVGLWTCTYHNVTIIQDELTVHEIGKSQTVMS